MSRTVGNGVDTVGESEGLVTRSTGHILAALLASGAILPGQPGERFYHRALSKKANSNKKAKRKQRQQSQRRNRGKR